MLARLLLIIGIFCSTVTSSRNGNVEEIVHVINPPKNSRGSSHVRAVSGSSLTMNVVAPANGLPVFLGRFCFSSLQQTSQIGQVVANFKPGIPPITIKTFGTADPQKADPLTSFTLSNDTFAFALSGELVNILHLYAFMPPVTASSPAVSANISIAIDGSYGSCGSRGIVREFEACADESNDQTCKRVEVNYMGDIDRITGTSQLVKGWSFLGKTCFQPGAVTAFSMNIQSVIKTSTGKPSNVIPQLLVYYEDDWLGASLYSGTCENRPIEPAYRFEMKNQTFVINTGGVELVLYLAIEACDSTIENVTYFVSVPKAFTCASPGTSVYLMQCLSSAGLFCKSYTSGSPDDSDLFTTPSKIPAAAVVYGLSFTLYPLFFFVFVAFVVLRNA